MKFGQYVLSLYLILLCMMLLCGYSYQTQATLSQEQSQKLHQIQEELNKTADVESMSYGSGILTIRSKDVISPSEIAKLKDKAEKFVPQKTEQEKAKDYLATVDMNDETKLKDIVKNLAIIQGIQ